MMQSKAVVLAVVALLVLGPPAASAQSATETIRSALLDWAAAFNEGRSEELCDIYAADLVATVRGQPDRGREEVCAQIERLLADPTIAMTYAPDIHEIIVEGDLAVVRLTWFLQVRQGVIETTATEPAMDVFRRDDEGMWKIIRFISYPSPEPG